MLSYLLRGQETVVRNVGSAIAKGHDIIIAPIAYYEVKRGLAAVGSQKRMSEFIRLCGVFGVGQLDNGILDIATDIWANQRRIGRAAEDADIFIAAYCINHGFTLVTHNIKHFTDISDLFVADWRE
jgi:predicted nucleic acid-binding protein